MPGTASGRQQPSIPAVPFSPLCRPTATWATPSHLRDGHPVPVVHVRGCGALRKRVVTGVGEVVAVSVSTIAVRKSFCKQRRKWLGRQAPLNLGRKKEKQNHENKCLDCFHSTSWAEHPPACPVHSAKLPEAAGVWLLPVSLKSVKIPRDNSLLFAVGPVQAGNASLWSHSCCNFPLF